MKFIFAPIDPVIVKKDFNDFYSDGYMYFEIYQNLLPIGIYGLKKLANNVSEISLFAYEEFRTLRTKGLAIKCLTFPFSIGFRKVLISTDLSKMVRFLNKMGKFGVQYLTEHKNMHWFEVNKK